MFHYGPDQSLGASGQYPIGFTLLLVMAVWMRWVAGNQLWPHVVFTSTLRIIWQLHLAGTLVGATTSFTFEALALPVAYGAVGITQACLKMRAGSRNTDKQ